MRRPRLWLCIAREVYRLDILRVIVADVRMVFVVWCCVRTGEEYERSNIFGTLVKFVDDRLLRSKYGFGGGMSSSSSSIESI